MQTWWFLHVICQIYIDSANGWLEFYHLFNEFCLCRSDDRGPTKQCQDVAQSDDAGDVIDVSGYFNILSYAQMILISHQFLPQ